MNTEETSEQKTDAQGKKNKSLKSLCMNAMLNIIQHGTTTIGILSNTNLYLHTVKTTLQQHTGTLSKYSYCHYKAPAKETWLTVFTTVKKVEEKQ